MLLVHDPQRRELVGASELPRKGWIHAIAPDADERAGLTEVGVPAQLLDHALDPRELARVDHDDDGGTLIVLRVPHVESEGQRSTTLGVVVVGDLLVTVATAQLEVIGALASREEVVGARPMRVFVELLVVTAAVFEKRVNDIDADVDRLEDCLQSAQRNEEITALLRQQKALVHFERALLSNQIMLERLGDDQRCGFRDDERAMLDNAVVEFRQAIQTTKISAEILSNMMDAFTSMISNNLNRVMKMLASLTVILAIPTMIAGLWGMNVALPMGARTWAFAALLGGTTALCLGVALLFVRNKWL